MPTPLFNITVPVTRTDYFGNEYQTTEERSQIVRKSKADLWDWYRNQYLPSVPVQEPGTPSVSGEAIDKHFENQLL